MRKTKIICTMGPSTDKGDVMEQLVREGMDVARFNFSHGPHDEQRGRIQKLRELRKKYDRPVAALLDTKGPEIRLGCFKDGKVSLEEGQIFTFTNKDIEGTNECVSITYKELYKDVRPGGHILVDDGLVDLEVQDISGKDIVCKVINAGVIGDKKGVNVPGANLKMPFISKKDHDDLLFGIQEGFDFVAASFTRTANDIREVRKILKENGGEEIQIIAKIENQQGVDNIDEIIEAADGIMIARGDMGVEIPPEYVPVIQQKIIQKVYTAGKPVITATQMLDSMISHPRPTRAEATDVANAIFQGTSATMLSGETAAGAYPVEAVQMMAKIAKRTEEAINYRKRFDDMAKYTNPGITDAICHATCSTAYDLDAKAIITVTKTGFSARMIAKYRPGCDIVGCAMDEKVCRQLNLSWGVQPILLGEEWEVFVLFERAINACKKEGLLENGDVTVITSGVPIGRSGTTNMLKVQVVAD